MSLLILFGTDGNPTMLASISVITNLFEYIFSATNLKGIQEPSLRIIELPNTAEIIGEVLLRDGHVNILTSASRLSAGMTVATSLYYDPKIITSRFKSDFGLQEIEAHSIYSPTQTNGLKREKVAADELPPMPRQKKSQPRQRKGRTRNDDEEN